MNLTPQEQFVTSILAITKINNFTDLGQTLENMEEKGYSISNTKYKYLEIRTLVTELQKKGVIDKHFRVSKTGLIRIQHLRIPIRSVVYLYQRFGY